MEAVTAVKIQSEYENPLKAGNPRTATARLINPETSNGPVSQVIEKKDKTAQLENKISAAISRINETFLFTISQVIQK
jgi:hypothetical protein